MSISLGSFISYERTTRQPGIPATVTADLTKNDLTPIGQAVDLLASLNQVGD